MNLTDPIFTDETKAREYFETVRWPEGPSCPHCGEVEKVYRLNGESHRAGLVHCNSCEGSFTVTTGTVMESSHVPLNKWALAYRLMASSKKGVSGHQLMRSLDVTYKTAWFMAHRIRESMRPLPKGRMGEGGKHVEIDEAYIGTDKSIPKPKGGYRAKLKVVSLVERGGEARSFHVENLNRATVVEIMFANVSRDASLNTDESHLYYGMGRYVGSHDTVNHGEEEYARGDVTTNHVEGFFSVFKRGMKGIYQHCGKQHLHRYLTEFDFRYSNRSALGVDDVLRTMRAVKGAEGRRLTYRQANGTRAPSIQ